MYYAVTDGKGIITLITRQHLKKMYKKKAEDSKMEKKTGISRPLLDIYLKTH